MICLYFYHPPAMLYHDRQKIQKCNNCTWHSADQSTIHEALENLRKIMRKSTKVYVRFICICAMSLRHPLALSLSLSLWSVRKSVSDGRSHYCRWWSRILQASVAVNVWGQIPDRRPAGGEGVLVSVNFPSPRPPVTAQRCPHMRWFAPMWMCKEDVEVDPEWLTHRLLQYPLAARASWQRRASHTWQTF